MKKLYCLTTLISISAAQAAHKLIEPILSQPIIQQRLRTFAQEVANSKGVNPELMATSLYDVMLDKQLEEKELLKHGLTQGTAHMLHVWDCIKDSKRTDFCSFYVPQIFFRGLPLFDAMIDQKNSLQVMLNFPLIRLYAHRLAIESPGTPIHMLHNPQQVPVDWHLHCSISKFDAGLLAIAKRMDNPNKQRMHLAVQIRS